MNDYLNSTTQNISWFKKSFDEGTLEMHPPFQRNPVWTDKQSSFLMDSILKGYPIPEIYLQEKVDATGKTITIVVDGQQRIRSFLRFISGEYSIDETQSTRWGGMAFSELSEEDKIAFYKYKFVVRVLPDIDEEEIRNIFKRINQNNVALNPQELRQSTYRGEFIQSMNYLADKYYWDEIGLFTPAKVRRMLDVEFVSELAIAFLNGLQNKKSKIDYYYALYEQEYQEREEVETLFDKVIGEILQALPDIKKMRWANLVDFYTLFLVLAEKSSAFPLSADKREALRKRLTSFAQEVTLFQKTDASEEKRSGMSQNVMNYASGIRNSSDLGSRRIRANSLCSELADIFSD